MTASPRFPDDVPVLTDGVVRLRAHVAADREAVYEQCVDPVSQRWTTVPVPYTRADADTFVGQTVPIGWSEGRWAFAVQADDDQGRPRFCGTVELIGRGDRRAEIAYGAHPWARGRGIMHRALQLLLTWGFEEQNLRAVIWWAHTGNWASRRTAWRLGFTCDGAVERWLPHRDDLVDAWVGVLHATDERSPRTGWLEAPRIAGDQVVLRPYREDDAPRTVEACSDERTAYWLGQMPSPYTLADAEAYLLSRGEMLAAGAGVSWAVADPDTDVQLGSISLFDLKEGREAEVGYLMHPDARGRGLMTEACGLAVRHGFTAAEHGGLGLRRILVYAAEGNTASRRVIEVNGFVQVGRERRGTRLRDGSLVDTACYDLLADEYSAYSAR